MLRGSEKLDAIDLKILAALQVDARVTNRALADAVGLSPSPCLQRVKRLEEAKLIKHYAAVLNTEKLIHHVYAYMEVTLNRHYAMDFLTFENYVKRQPEMLQCSLISGDFDYLISVIASDVGHLHRISDHMFNADVGVGKHFTYIVVKQVKETREIPIAALVSARAETAIG